MTSEKQSDILKDVVAFVDVWSSSRTENYSKPFIQQLQEMGAEVSKTFHKQVTHVVFSNGHQSTWNKAKKTGVKLVSVLWVDRCKDGGEHIDEELCPAMNEGSHSNPALSKRTHRCMQPRDIPEKTPENNKTMKRKLDRMMKNLAVSSPSSPDLSPFFVDEESGIIYSPASRRAGDMALRLKVMRERRESLSRTDSNDEDDSSDLDTSFSDFSRSSTSKKSEGEGRDSHERSTFDLPAARSVIEMNGSAAESLTRTDAKELESVSQAKKESVERPCPRGLLREPRGPEPQKHSDSSFQSSALECRMSLEGPSLDLFRGSAVTQSPAGLVGQAVKKRRKSSFRSDRAEKASPQSPSPMGLLGEGKSTSPVEMQHLLNIEENVRYCQRKTSKAHSLLRGCGRSVSLPVSASESFVRKWDGCRQEQASPLEAFCRRRSAVLTLIPRASPELPRVSTPTGDGEFENYFSPTNRAENGGRRRAMLLSLPSELTPLPPIEEEPKLQKRKRRRSEACSPGPARGRRRVSLLNGT